MNCLDDLSCIRSIEYYEQLKYSSTQKLMDWCLLWRILIWKFCKAYLMQNAITAICFECEILDEAVRWNFPWPYVLYVTAVSVLCGK